MQEATKQKEAAVEAERFKAEGSKCLVWNQLGNAAAFDA